METRWPGSVRGSGSDHRGRASAAVIDEFGTPQWCPRAEIAPGVSCLVVVNGLVMTTTVLADGGVANPQRG